MSAPVIYRPKTFSQKQIAELKEIFFESSSKKDFKDKAEKEAFYDKYLGFYLTYYADFFWVAEADKILGYLAGSPSTDDSRLHQIQPHLKVFESYFKDYPAHLHINLHSEARGMGLGGKLVNEFKKQLQESKITGLHIMTGTDSRNKSFYQRLGFDFEVTLNFLGNPILLMGSRMGITAQHK